MKKLIWITSFIVLTVVFAFPALLSLGLKYLPANIQPPLDKTKDVYGIFTVSQEFISLKPGLMSVGMSIKNPNLQNKENVFFNLYNDKKELIRAVKYSGANIEDGAFVKFMFDPILDSKNQIYSFEISSPNAGPEQVLPIFYSERNPSWIRQMMHGKEEVVGGVSLVTFHKPESKIKVIEEIYFNWFSRLLFPHFQIFE
ncbi:MAG: hypothetical protein ABIJ05_02345 [Patescibacteria group bacterium]